MRFLIQIPQLIYGGAEKVLVNFANVLVEHGHEVEILEIYEKGLLKEQFDKRVRFDAICSKEYQKKYYASLGEIRNERNVLKKAQKCTKLAFSKVVGYRRFAEYLCAKKYKDKQYDVAINYLEIDSPQFLLKNIDAKKYLQWIHIDIANMSNPNDLNQYLNMYKRMDYIFCVAESAKESFVEKYPELEIKTKVLYNFYDVNHVLEMSNQEIAFDYQVPKMLSVGRLTEQKQYLRFLNVLKRLKEENFNFSWHVLGTGIEEEIIRERIREYELEQNVYLHGVVDNPYKYMKNCDLFVLPSGWEGFPTVTIEAKILNCPVLSTDVSGIREQLVHDETGWIVDNDEDSIYEGIKYLLINSKQLDKLRLNEGIERICDKENNYNRFMKLINEELYEGGKDTNEK